MKQFTEFAKCVVFVLLAITLIILSQAISDFDAAFNELRPKIVSTVSDTDEAAQKGIEAFGALETTADNQATYWKDLPRITKKTVDDFHDLVIHTDVQLNGTQNDRMQGLIPQATYDLRTMNASLADFSGMVEDADHTIQAFPPLIGKFSVTADNLNRIVEDPNIPLLLQSAADAFSQLEGMSVDGHAASSLALKEMQAYFKPVSMSMRIFKFLTGHLIDGTEMWYYLTQ
jgi:hypothetical protein